jgi:hypothetical protein
MLSGAGAPGTRMVPDNPADKVIRYGRKNSSCFYDVFITVFGPDLGLHLGAGEGGTMQFLPS